MTSLALANMLRECERLQTVYGGEFMGILGPNGTFFITDPSKVIYEKISGEKETLLDRLTRELAPPPSSL